MREYFLGMCSGVKVFIESGAPLSISKGGAFLELFDASNGDLVASTRVEVVWSEPRTLAEMGCSEFSIPRGAVYFSPFNSADGDMCGLEAAFGSKKYSRLVRIRVARRAHVRR